MTHTVESLMALATQYHEATINWVASGEPTAKARAALQSALTEVLAERDTLQSKCDELAAEIERLNEQVFNGNDVKVAMAIQHTTEVNQLRAKIAAMESQGTQHFSNLSNQAHGFNLTGAVPAVLNAGVTHQVSYLAPGAVPKPTMYRLMHKEGAAWIPASEWMTEADASWKQLVQDKPDEWRIQEPLNGKKVADAFRTALAPGAAQKEPCIHKDVPSSCYRVRCQLGSKCIDDDMSFRAAPAAQKEPDMPKIGCVQHDCDECKARAQAPAAQPLTDEQLREAFGKLYPRDIGILELAENNRDYAVEAIGARHHWTAFKAGAKAIEAAHGIGKEQKHD